MQLPLERTDPLQRQVTFAATYLAAQLARRALDEAIPPPALLVRHDDASLVLSEIVTNAVQHGSVSTDFISMFIAADEESLRVRVSQAGSVAGVHLVDPRFTDVTNRGYGLQLVDSLTDSWGAGTDPDRHVWFEFLLHVNQRWGDGPW
jgi:anti-sigma regulatory factor (Ser/Thr protein kinase)